MTLPDVQGQALVLSGDRLVVRQKLRASRASEAIEHLCTLAFDQVTDRQCAAFGVIARFEHRQIDFASCLLEDRT